ncbi:MAG: FHA domain-containing protein [Myxococcales bacterium]|jgi:pSer/pThr/pTyr-binding forkhead associated (FHA) protein
MAKAPQRRPAARRPPQDADEVIELGTGDIDLSLLNDESEPTAVKLPPTKILPADPQRAVPTTIYPPEHLDPPSSPYRQPDLDDEEETTLPTPMSKPPPPVAEPLLAPAFLVVKKGPGAGTSLPVLEGELTIGRSSANSLNLPLPSISRHHATLVRHGEHFILRDEGSHNGTYLNGRRVSGQIEIRSGDEISLGKAVLILRLASAESEMSTATSVAIPERPWIRLAIFGAAMVLGVVSVFALASLRSRPAPEPAVARAPAADTVVAEPPRRKPPPPQPVAPAPRETPSADINLAGSNELSASQVFEEAKGKRAPPVNEIEPPRSLERRHSVRHSRNKRRPQPKPASEVDSPEARSLFEKGDIDGALAAAKRAGAGALASKISSFKRELAAAKADLSFKDGAGAIRHFTAALALEEEIADGWSASGGEIRAQLSRLYEIAGLQEIERGNNSKAIGYLERALSYDPTNAKAKQFLGKLKSAPVDARSAADEAFGD